MKANANAAPKGINPDEAKVKAAIRIMVAVALRILEGTNSPAKHSSGLYGDWTAKGKG